MDDKQYRDGADHGGYVEVAFSRENEREYPGRFGVFLEVGYGRDEFTLIELPRKKARKLAKAILKMTKKGKR